MPIRPGQPAEQAEHEEDGPEFDEQDGDVRSRALRRRYDLHAGSAVRCAVRRTGRPVKDVRDLSMAACVPTVTTRSPGSSTKSGVGDGNAAPWRSTATIDAPVRVRTCVSPSGRASIRRVRRHRQLLDDQSLGLALKHGQSKCQRWSAQYLGDRVGLVLGQSHGRGGAVPLLVVEDQISQSVSPA